MLRSLRRVAAKRDEMIAAEKARVASDRSLAGPGEAGAGAPVRRRRRTTEEAAE
jgi:DNA-directed RNA polymerase subunit beta'